MRSNPTYRVMLLLAGGLGLLGLMRTYYEFLLSHQGRRMLGWFERHPLWLLALVPLAVIVSGIAAWLVRRAGARRLVVPVAVLAGALATSVYSGAIGLFIGLGMGLAFAFPRLDRFAFNIGFAFVFSGLLLAVATITGRFARTSYYSGFDFAVAASSAIYVLGAAVSLALIFAAGPLRRASLHRILGALRRERSSGFRLAAWGIKLAWASVLIAGGIWMGWQWEVYRRMAALDRVGRADMIWTGGAIFSMPKSIRLGPEARDEHLRLLRGIPNVYELSLYNAQITDEGFRHVSSLRELFRLHLYRVPVDDQTLLQLAGLPWLQDLRIEDVPVTRRVFQLLPTLPSLVECTIINIVPEGPSIEKIALPGGLSHIDWSGCGLSDGDLACLAGHQSLFRLTLRNNDIQGPGLAHINKCTWLENVDLTNNPIDDQHIIHLASLPIKGLMLDGVRLSDAGVAGIEQLQQILFLSVRDSGISVHQLHRITASTRLQRAHVDAINLSPRAMLGCPRLINLELFVDGHALEAADIARLAQLGARVTLVECDLTPSAVAELPHHAGLFGGYELILERCCFDDRFSEAVSRYVTAD